MSTLQFKCDVTEFEIIPHSENNENHFYILDKCLVITLVNTDLNNILMQTEIEKNDAIELAKLILFKYT
jgi:hypothetical protein